LNISTPISLYTTPWSWFDYARSFVTYEFHRIEKFI